jgi:signal transduction histidine kinase/streptogramin lyase
VGTEYEGLYYFDTATRKFRRFAYASQGSALNNKVITGLYLNSDEQLWISTDGGGLNVLSPADSKLTYIRHNPFDPLSLSNDQVQFMYEDSKKNLWLGNYNGGLNIYFRGKRKFEHFYQILNDESSLSHNAVLCFEEGSDGKIWIGTDGGGLNLFDPVKGTFKRFRHLSYNTNSLSGDVVKCVYKDETGLLWIGTYAEGLNLYNPFTGSFRHFRNDMNDPASLSSNHIWDIFRDSRGDIYLGTLDGLNRYDKEKERFIRYYHNENQPNSISSNSIICIYEDSYNNLWIGTDGGGLNILNRDDETFSMYTNIENDTTSLSNDFVKVIFEDAHRNLWVGTMGGGLNLFNRTTRSFRAFSTNNVLPSDNIHGIIEDNSNNLWLSTSNGICRMNYLSGEVRSYSEDDGLQDVEFIYSSYLKASNGDCYFGGINGFNRFKPEALKNNSYVPPVLLTNFYLFNKKVEIGSPGSVLDSAICMSEEIELGYLQNVFSIEFAALDYTSPPDNRYKYILKNFDKEWRETDAKHRLATYTNLDPGEYTFRVIASNNDDIWNSEGVSLRIIIRPPFWRTWWFRIIAVIISMIILLAVYFARIAHIKQRNQTLETEVRNRTRELNEKNKVLLEQTTELNETNTLLEERQQQIEEQTEEISSANDQLLTTNHRLRELNAMKDKFFSIIGHDLKNPINVILGFSELLKTRAKRLSSEQMEIYVSSIYDSALNTSNLLANLLDWARSQSGRMLYQPGKTDAETLIRDNILLLKEYSGEKKITLTLQKTHDLMKAFCDSNMADTIIRNLLTNAIKYTHSGGKIEVLLSSDAKLKEVKVVVKDTGVGMPADKIRNLFSIEQSFSSTGTAGETGTGLGLILCKEFIEKNNGTISVESEPDKGSVFTFTLPAAEE